MILKILIIMQNFIVWITFFGDTLWETIVVLAAYKTCYC